MSRRAREVRGAHLEEGGRRLRTAIVSTYPPRACGIGSFAADVRASLLRVDGVDSVDQVVVVNEPSRPQRPGVVATIEQAVRGDYVRAARVLGRLDVEVVLLQHEYGIFGGRDGEYVLSFAEELAQPLVVTLHTVLSQPIAHQARVLAALCGRAQLVTVMTETAARLLVQTGACTEDKIRVVPHGAPAILTRRAQEPGRSKRGHYARIADRFVLSTFGLLSAGKGIETVIEALPAVVERHPEVLYVIAGRTHPDVARREGERYRLRLEQAVIDARLTDHVVFDDRFLTVPDLADLLAVTSVFVTPYREREQIVSGALTFGLAAGCAVASTPYWYAEDMLSSGAGAVFEFGDAAALTEVICRFVTEPEALASARAEARRIGDELAWPSVAETLSAALAEAVEAAPRPRTVTVTEPHLDRVRVDHLLTLIDDVGIVQHAHGVIPNRKSGYCVDDATRLVPIALELARRLDEQTWMPILYRALAFLHDATEPDGMHNFMSYDRHWLDEPHIGDHVGRTIWALGETLETAWVPAVADPAGRLLDTLVETFPAKTGPRAAAYAVLGLARLDPDRLGRQARLLLERLVAELANAYSAHASDEWRWFENELTYDNARLAQAVIAGGVALDHDEITQHGLESLRWLGDECGLTGEALCVTGHLGRRRGEPAPGRGDEQPIDASALVEAELVAFEVTGEMEHAMRAQRAFAWFLGRNRLRRPLYDFATGGCCDGLGDEELNGNEGAESTLALHRAALLLDAAGLPTVERVPTPVATPA